MEPIRKLKDWLKENAPMLSVVYENKYVGMVYDRFASLPAKQQRQVLIGGFAGVIGIIFLYLFFSYWSLWSYSKKASRAYQMVALLQQHQKYRRDKSADINTLERNNQLASQGALKNHLVDLARSSAISAKLVQIEEKDTEGGRGDDQKPESHEPKIKQATVKMQRLNLTQLKTFLENVEFGSY
ncbi:MAG: hypothetical protein HY537_01065, partial [Deltaproteobacteria bacterium]|nr:hypothetical protein [Deltaproteobacteria bacterium]